MDAGARGRGRGRQRAHDLEVAAAVPSRGRAGFGRSKLGAGASARPHPARAGAGDRTAAPGAADRLGDRRAVENAALDRVDGPAPDRARTPLSSGTARAAEPLSARAAGRARPHRCQEARPDRPARASRQRRPAHPQPRCRLGVRARRRRRRHPARPPRGARRREGGDSGRFPSPRRRPLRRLRDPGRAGDDLQRLLLPSGRARARLPRARPPAPAHASLPAPHQASRPNDSSAPCSAAGPTAPSTRPQRNALGLCQPGSTSTISEDPTAASAAKHRPRASTRSGTTLLGPTSQVELGERAQRLLEGRDRIRVQLGAHGGVQPTKDLRGHRLEAASPCGDRVATGAGSWAARAGLPHGWG